MRKLLVGGNWKCNGTLQSIKDLSSNVLNKAEFDSNKVEVVVAPISVHLTTVKSLVNPNIQVSCQNMSATGTGAFTGEIAGEQIKDLDIQWVIIGHSERRTLFGEDDSVVAAKVAKAQALGLNAMVCCGESLEIREAGTTNDFLKGQLDAIKGSITDWSKIVIAYEPIWAIGTGKSATATEAVQMHQAIRGVLKEIVPAAAPGISILYGGSVTAENAPELFAYPEIQGVLVGGASLDTQQFAAIIRGAAK